MASLLAGLPETVPGGTVNRLCGSGLDALGTAARAIRTGEADLMIAGGVESMSRAPFVMGKAGSAFSRDAQVYDTTIGWRFVNPAMERRYGIDSMPETAENVAEAYQISRAGLGATHLEVVADLVGEAVQRRIARQPEDEVDAVVLAPVHPSWRP